MTVSFNPFDPAQVDHQDEVLDELRHTAPVIEMMPGFFYLTRHEDCVAVSRDPVTFPQAPFSPLASRPKEPSVPGDLFCTCSPLPSIAEHSPARSFWASVAAGPVEPQHVLTPSERP